MTNRNKAVLWVLTVFLLGVLSGGTLAYLLIPVDSSQPVSARREGRPRLSHKEAMERLAKDLGLDSQQQAQVDQIFSDARQESHAAFKEVRKRIHKRLKEVLRPEQFEQFQKAMRERRQSDHGGSPDGRPPDDQREQ
ncbi:MAG TPA: hypothetical protein PLP42_18440 [Acidobacteriota bacterium]|jgi:Spy/CpxP family protein refolding chaperone|nr:hypothetical protein [Acidobacteriota bacterium]